HPERGALAKGDVADLSQAQVADRVGGFARESIDIPQCGAARGDGLFCELGKNGRGGDAADDDNNQERSEKPRLHEVRNAVSVPRSADWQAAQSMQYSPRRPRALLTGRIAEESGSARDETAHPRRTGQRNSRQLCGRRMT